MESNKPLPERFRLHRPLGRGASGEVLLVGDLLRGRDVALKVLDDPDDPAFRAEFPTLARLSHPSLVRVLEWIDGVGFTMDPVVGLDLLTALRGPREKRVQTLVLGQRVEGASFTALDPPALLRLRVLFAQIFDALSALHHAGLVHGDLRPENVLVTDDDRAVILDLDHAAPPQHERREGVAVGTATYLAPEIADGVRTFASDVYAAGTLLFEALTGDTPFAGSAQEVFIRKSTVAAPRTSFLVGAIPADLDDLCAACLDRHREARPAAQATAQRLLENC
jgi:serine/threonine protein kinase